MTGMSGHRRMQARWTPRRDGIVRTTFIVKVDVPYDLVEFITAHTLLNQGGALAWIKSRLSDITDGWNVVACDQGDDEPVLVHAEGDGQAYDPADDYGHVYEGPEVRTR